MSGELLISGLAAKCTHAGRPARLYKRRELPTGRLPWDGGEVRTQHEAGSFETVKARVLR